LYNISKIRCVLEQADVAEDAEEDVEEVA